MKVEQIDFTKPFEAFKFSDGTSSVSYGGDHMNLELLWDQAVYLADWLNEHWPKKLNFAFTEQDIRDIVREELEKTGRELLSGRGL